MRRRITYLAVWLIVTLGATAAASIAVFGVTSSVARSPGQSLSGRQVRDALLAGHPGRSSGAAAAADPARAGPDNEAPPGPAGTGAMPAQAGSPATIPTPGPSTTAAPSRPHAGSISGAIAPGAPPSTTVPAPRSADSGGESEGSPPPTTGPSGEVTKVFSSQGGVATVSCRAGAASLVSSSPQNGFTETIGSAGPETVSVTFTSPSHQSEIHAACINGQPSAQIDESSGSSDS